MFLGATMSSEQTAAAFGQVGQLRFDPFAMLPFCGYNMADYFAHWLEVGRREGAQLPKIFYVNWFRKGEDGKFLWPGFGENSRVLEWVFRRCDGEGEVRETPIGLVPAEGQLNIDGLSISADEVQALLEVDEEAVKAELPQVREHLDKFGDKLPAEIRSQLEQLEQRLLASRRSVVVGSGDGRRRRRRRRCPSRSPLESVAARREPLDPEPELSSPPPSRCRWSRRRCRSRSTPSRSCRRRRRSRCRWSRRRLRSRSTRAGARRRSRCRSSRRAAGAARAGAGVVVVLAGAAPLEPERSSSLAAGAAAARADPEPEPSSSSSSPEPGPLEPEPAAGVVVARGRELAAGAVVVARPATAGAAALVGAERGEPEAAAAGGRGAVGTERRAPARRPATAADLLLRRAAPSRSARRSPRSLSTTTAPPASVPAAISVAPPLASSAPAPTPPPPATISATRSASGAFGDVAREGDPVGDRGGGQRGGGGAQRRAGAVDEPADRAVGQPERAGDVLVALALDGGAQERLALQLGQAREARPASGGRRCGARGPPRAPRRRGARRRAGRGRSPSASAR